jgi:hypothetical protein
MNGVIDRLLIDRWRLIRVKEVLRGDKELKSFDLHPGDYIVVF